MHVTCVIVNHVTFLLVLFRGCVWGRRLFDDFQFAPLQRWTDYNGLSSVLLCISLLRIIWNFLLEENWINSIGGVLGNEIFLQLQNTDCFKLTGFLWYKKVARKFQVGGRVWSGRFLLPYEGEDIHLAGSLRCSKLKVGQESLPIERVVLGKGKSNLDKREIFTFKWMKVTL